MAKHKRKRRSIKSSVRVKLDIPQPLLTVGESCVQLRCGVTRLYELINQGELEAKKLGDRTLITQQSILKLIDSLPRVPTQKQRTAPVRRRGIAPHRKRNVTEARL